MIFYIKNNYLLSNFFYILIYSVLLCKEFLFINKRKIINSYVNIVGD